jgi:hypothetical protein
VASDASGATYAAGLAAAVMLAVCSCSVPDSPSATKWADDCDQQSSTVASALATSAEVLRLVGDDRVPSRYARVVLVQAEESADKAITSAEALQPPSSALEADRRVMQVLEDAASAVRDARVALAADAEPTHHAVTVLQAELRRHHRAVTGVALPSCAAVGGEG